MDLTGKIVQLLETQTGVSKNGEWKKKEFVLETQDQYPKHVCFSMWGDKIDQYPLEEGELVIVYFNLESKEYNGRWYTDVRAWKITKQDRADTPPPALEEPPLHGNENEIKETDTLPF